jgi:hypothetical protein
MPPDDMHPTLKLADLIKGDEMVRFFWTDEPHREVGIHSYDASGVTVGSESCTRDSARARWSQLLRAGFVKGKILPNGKTVT